jgi:UDP-N-acetylmuramyl pentapeptide phosphotransferase/UDP-N-acetylglucosamine-1-phosphate transferase
MSNFLVFIAILFATILAISFYNKNYWVLKYLKTNDEFSYESLNSTNPKNVITGTGFIFLVIFYLSLIFFNYYKKVALPNNFIYFVAMSFLITIISLIDDIKKLDPILRLLIQLFCVFSSLTCLYLITVNIPLKIVILLSLIIWIYLINITNFIDGSDGVCCINVLNFFIGILILDYFYDLNCFSVIIAKIIIPILIAFFFFNYPPAKNYMGDAGSIFLGFLVGFSFLELIIKEMYFVIILYIYPLLDCSITLFKKILKGYMPWARLGDYYFLKPKKLNSYNFKELSIVSKKVFYLFFIYSILNFILIILSVYLNNKIFFFANIILAFGLILIFNSEKIKPS